MAKAQAKKVLPLPRRQQDTEREMRRDRVEQATLRESDGREWQQDNGPNRFGRWVPR